jgi:WD40 repeat protein/serine/threonine protein kinase
VIRRLGSGGFGVVFLAEDPMLRRPVAIKMPLATIFQSQQLHDRFLRECRAAAMLNHPGIVRVLESGDVHGIPYQVAEFVDGERLSDLVKRQRPSVVSAAKIVRSLADAVQHAHDHGVLHRDIKPDNILLQTHQIAEVREPLSRNLPASGVSDNNMESRTEAGAVRLINATQSPDALPRITDFGLARLADDDSALSRSGMLVGTPKYMSPEQLHGKVREQGPPTDIYALGVVLHELLTGSVPFADAEGLQSRIAISKNTVPAFRSRYPWISKDLETICLKCLQMRPEDRYASAGDLRDDLSRYLDGRPTLARPVPAIEQFLRWVTGNQKLAGLLGLLMLSVFVVLVQAVRNDRASRQQNKVLSTALSQLTAEKQRADQSLTLADKNRVIAEQSESRYRDTAWLAQQGQYSTAIMQAASAWQSGEIARMNQTIVPFLPRGDDALRGFEWRYLWNQGQVLRTLTGHSESVNALTRSADGERLYTIGNDNTIRRWDLRSGLLEMTSRLRGQAYHFEVSISQHSHAAVIFRMLHREQIDEVAVYDLQTGRVIMRRTFPVKCIGGVAISNDGSTVLVAGSKTTDLNPAGAFVEMWLPKTDTVIEDNGAFRELVVGDKRIGGHAITEIKFTPDGKSLVIAAMGVFAPTHSQLLLTTLNDVFARVPGKPEPIFGPLTPISWQPGIVHTMAFSPNGTYLATRVLDDEHTFRADVWDLKKHELFRRSEVLSRSIDSIAFDATGTRLALGVTLPGLNSDGVPAGPNEPAVTEARSELRLWDYAADVNQTLPYEAKREIVFLQPMSPVAASGWFVGQGGGALNLWQPGVVSAHRDLHGHRPKEVWDLAFSGDGATVFSVGDDHMLRSWDLASGVEKKSADPRSILVSCVAVSPDGRWVAAGGYDDEVVVYDAQSLNPVATLRGHTHDVRAVAFSSDSQMLASGGRDKNIRIWNVPGFELAGVREGHFDTVRALAWTTEGQLISAGSDRRILTWDSKGVIIHERYDFEGIHSMAFAPAGVKIPLPSAIATPAHNNFRDDSRSTTMDFNNTDHQNLMILKADELLASGMNHGALRLWHRPTDTVLFEAQRHGVQLNSLAFSPDGQTLAVAGNDETVSLYHVATGRNVLTFDKLGSSVHRVIFSPDGTHLLAALHDGTIRTWYAPHLTLR